MALRDQPYLPLYIQDFLTDEKLAFCSASANGVYIRLMCLMHKSEEYGTILLKQNFKQEGQQVLSFATMLARQMPYPINVVEDGLNELLTERVITIEGDMLAQKRMIKDNQTSLNRALSGRKGGKKTAENMKILAETKEEAGAVSFAEAKATANTENEYEYENEVVIDISFYKNIVDYLNAKAKTAYRHTGKKTQSLIKARMNEGFVEEDFRKVIDNRVHAWADDPEMVEYLRPETLFSNKFEGYLNAKVIERSGTVKNGFIKNEVKMPEYTKPDKVEAEMTEEEIAEIEELRKSFTEKLEGKK